MELLDEEIYILPSEKYSDKRLIYAPIRGFVQLIDLQEAEIIEKYDTSLIKNFNGEDFISRIIKTIKNTPLKDLDIMQKGFPMLNIDFSNGCTMRCIYCYANRGEGVVIYQKKENIEKIISIYFDYLMKQSYCNEESICYIVFSNDAEPTYAPDLLIYTVEEIKKKAKECHLKPLFSMPTNGTFSIKTRNFIIENFESISLSFDGLEKIQNLHRPLIDGNHSYQIVYQNAKALYNSDLKISFNIVVTKHNINMLKETINYFHEHFPGVSISFSKVNLTGRILKEHDNLTVDEIIFQIKLMEAINYAKNTSIKVTDKNIKNYHIPRRHYCTSTAKPNWNVNLNGEIYACMESKADFMKIGEIDFTTKELKLLSKHIESLTSYSVNQIDRCRNCFAKYLCVGGCKVRNEIKSEECEKIRQKCLNAISEVYDKEQWLNKAQSLFLRG